MRTIIVGCGRMGAGLAQYLSSSGHDITVIDQDAATFKQLGPSFKGQTIAGVGFDHDVLLRAKIERTDALAAVTSSDEANAVIARLASQVFRVPRVVARLFDPRKAEIYRRLGLQTFDPTTLGIYQVADLLCYSPLDTVLSMGNGVNIVKTEIPALLVGRRVNELTIPGEVNVIAISRDNRTFLPTKGTEFQQRDLIHLAVATTATDRLRILLGLA